MDAATKAQKYHDDFAASIAEKIIGLMDDAGLSLDDLAIRLNVTPGELHDIVHSIKCDITVKDLITIVHALDPNFKIGFSIPNGESLSIEGVSNALAIADGHECNVIPFPSKKP
jgi:hypothetical protein